MSAVSGGLGRRTFGVISALTLVVGVIIVGAAVPATAGGNPGGAITYITNALMTAPGGPTLGPDGTFWFPNGTGPAHGTIERMTFGGTVTDFANTKITYPGAMTVGPDGALWFTQEDQSVGRITTSGVVTVYPDPGLDSPVGIVTGPDGNLWIANEASDGPGSIDRITTAGVVKRYRRKLITFPTSITVGSDGALWFTDGSNTIGRITVGGVISFYSDPTVDDPGSIVAGHNGALWFTNEHGGTSDSGSIGRITTSGVITHYTDPSIFQPFSISSGPDGALWFDDTFGFTGAVTIGRITTGGVVTNYSDPNGEIGAGGLTAGPDGALWFPRSSPAAIGRITTPSFAAVWPKSGEAGLEVNVSGAGFSAGESVSASYKTGLTSPKSVALCTTTAVSSGTFSCNGTIPTTDAGALGKHTISVEGATSGTTASATFTRTTVAKSPTITFKHTFTGTQEIVSVTGSGFVPFGGSEVTVFDPVAGVIHDGFPTTSVAGTFTVNVVIPEYSCRGDATIAASQFSPIAAFSNALTDPGYC